MRRALVVVDMVNDFIEASGALSCGAAGLRAVEPALARVRDSRERGDFIVFACDAHAPADPEFELWPRHCVAGTRGAELYGPLQAFYETYADEGQDLHYLPKMHYDAFHETDLDSLLRERGVGEVAIAGVCTSICCYATAGGAYFRRYRVLIDPSAMADLTPEAHAFAVRHMQDVYRARVLQRA